MQFTGHSLPVHQSLTLPWDFNPVPYCQPSSPTPMEYATSASLEWYFWPGRKSIYYSILADFNNAGWYRFFHKFSVPPEFFSKPFLTIPSTLTKLVSPSSSCSTTFLVLRKGQNICQGFAFFHFLTVIRVNDKIHKMKNSFFWLNGTYMVFWPGFGDPFVSEHFYASHSQREALVCAYTI